jgi:hypothetical protein
MLKQLFKKALPRQISKQSSHHQRRCQRVEHPNDDADTESNATGRQNSDLSGFFQLDLPQNLQDSSALEQQPAAWQKAGQSTRSNPQTRREQEPAERRGVADEDRSNSSNGSAKQRKQRALQRRRAGPVCTPSASLYQISALLSLSTYFEYKVRYNSLLANEGCLCADFFIFLWGVPDDIALGSARSPSRNHC